MTLRRILIRYLSEPRPAALVVDGLIALLGYAVMDRASAWLFVPLSSSSPGDVSPLQFIAQSAYAATTFLYWAGIVLCTWGCVRLLAESWGRPAPP